MKKEWRSIPGYEDLYLISNYGDVVGLKRGIQNPSIDSYGYYRTALCKNAQMKSFYVHRLVALAFIPNTDNKSTVNHIDEDKTNNYVGNLEWATTEEQNLHGTRLERAAESMRTNGKRYRAVDQLSPDGKLIKRWPGIIVAVRALGVQKASINKCCRGIQKHAAGFIWRYSDGEIA